jgi:hypothetical protein
MSMIASVFRSILLCVGNWHLLTVTPLSVDRYMTSIPVGGYHSEGVDRSLHGLCQRIRLCCFVDVFLWFCFCDVMLCML